MQDSQNDTKPNYTHKDSVFTDLFQNHPENFLSLYNAIHDTDLKMEEVTIEPKRIEQTLYHTFHNDVSMILNGRLIVLIEHQSTINENMPLRYLDYVTRIYERLIPNNNRYQKNLCYIPEPEFYVFYNGTDRYPDKKILRLSDSYSTQSSSPKLELEVTVFNISNPTSDTLKLLNRCGILKQYCECVEVIRALYKKDNPQTFTEAIKQCISKGILSDYLTENSKEAINMLVHDYDYETDIRVQREESFAAGQKQGASQKAESVAIALLKEGDSVEKVARCINLPLEYVRKLAEEIIVEL